MSNVITKQRIVRKHRYYTGKTSTITEYKFYQNGEFKHQSNSGSHNITSYKKYIKDLFDADEIEVKEKPTYRI